MRNIRLCLKRSFISTGFPLIIFYIVIYLMNIALMQVDVMLSKMQNYSFEITMNSAEMPGVIFFAIMIMINCIASFKAIISMGGTRRSFFIGNISSFLLTAILASGVNTIMVGIFDKYSFFIPIFKSVFKNKYTLYDVAKSEYLLEYFIWLASMIFLVVVTAFLLALLWYRFNTIGKASLFAVAGLIVSFFIFSSENIEVGIYSTISRKIVKLLVLPMGDSRFPIQGAFYGLLFAVIISALAYLVIRRVPIKNR